MINLTVRAAAKYGNITVLFPVTHASLAMVPRNLCNVGFYSAHPGVKQPRRAFADEPRVHLHTLNVRMACLWKWGKMLESDMGVNLYASYT